MKKRIENTEIKFRAWNGRNMFSLAAGYHLIFWGAANKTKFGLYIDAEDTLISKEERGLVVMRYTGFKDANGKEIYEGDIMRTGDITWRVYFGNNEQDGYKSTGWCAQSDYKGKTYFIDRSIVEGVVIGNIYQNKKLFKPRKRG